MSKPQIIDFIKQNSEIDIYYEYLLGQTVWYFQREDELLSYKKYDDFKRFISQKLGIPFNNIAVVGSAKTKFSFSPTDKHLKEFNEKSDLDLILVSNEMYKTVWNAYKEIASSKLLYNYSNKCSNIFNGFITLKDNDETYGHDSLISWQRKVNTFKAELQLKFKLEHDVNYRIYNDWESVQNYHLRGIAKLKEIINETY